MVTYLAEETHHPAVISALLYVEIVVLTVFVGNANHT